MNSESLLTWPFFLSQSLGHAESRILTFPLGHLVLVNSHAVQVIILLDMRLVT